MEIPLNKAWLAGFFDGEGCISSQLQWKPSKYIKHPRIYIQVSISQKDRSILDQIQKEYGGIVRVCVNAHKLTIVGKDRMKHLLSDIAPYSICKRPQILFALEFLDTLREENLGCKPLSEEIHLKRENIHNELKLLKKVIN